MFSARILPSVLVVLALVFAFAACGKKDDAHAPTHLYKSEIRLDDAVADQGCLSLPKLFAGIHDLDPTRQAVVVPTSISFDSPNGVREDFRRLIAYGQLTVPHESLDQAQAQVPTDASQDGCSKVTLNGPDGAPKDFTVKSSTRQSIQAEADDGERIEYTWASPQSVQWKHRYAAFDQPCSSSDKPVMVTVSKVLDWSDLGVPQQVPASGSPYSIDADFIGLASAAVGDSPDSFYVQGSDGSRQIDLSKIGALSSKPPRPDVVSCGGVAEPTPDPANPPSPSPSPVDPHNPDPDHPPHGDDTPGPNR